MSACAAAQSSFVHEPRSKLCRRAGGASSLRSLAAESRRRSMASSASALQSPARTLPSSSANAVNAVHVYERDWSRGTSSASDSAESVPLVTNVSSIQSFASVDSAGARRTSRNGWNDAPEISEMCSVVRAATDTSPRRNCRRHVAGSSPQSTNFTTDERSTRRRSGARSQSSEINSNMSSFRRGSLIGMYDACTATKTGSLRHGLSRSGDARRAESTSSGPAPQSSEHTGRVRSSDRRGGKTRLARPHRSSATRSGRGAGPARRETSAGPAVFRPSRRPPVRQSHIRATACRLPSRKGIRRDTMARWCTCPGPRRLTRMPRISWGNLPDRVEERPLVADDVELRLVLVLGSCLVTNGRSVVSPSPTLLQLLSHCQNARVRGAASLFGALIFYSHILESLLSNEAREQRRNLRSLGIAIRIKRHVRLATASRREMVGDGKEERGVRTRRRAENPRAIIRATPPAPPHNHNPPT
ncbi:hypothetical protein AURDEDRAFT_126544 [Auricularia subglabra TFB-10046 SS5]|nr:hypothetical protein AURDEDRAFT_126544 [Auricularia subglabra TFB-10046 SS5]